jgi:hypothetical protein
MRQNTLSLAIAQALLAEQLLGVLDSEQHGDQPAVEAVQRAEGDVGVHAGHRLACHRESMGTPRHGVSP